MHSIILVTYMSSEWDIFGNLNKLFSFLLRTTIHCVNKAVIIIKNIIFVNTHNIRDFPNENQSCY